MSDDAKVLKIELPDLVNKTLEPVATSIGVTLSDIWNGVFGGLSLWSEKKSLERSQNLEEYKRQLELKLSQISEENLQEPKVSIVGPAIEASKYYFESKEYREMFSNLIASASNKTMIGSVHTSFTDIIKQLEPNDAVLLKNLMIHQIGFSLRFPVVRLKKILNNNSEDYIDKNFTIFDDSDESHLMNDFSIENLIRLNLISISYDAWFTNSDLYTPIESKPFIKAAKTKVEQSLVPNQTVNFSHGYGIITTYGMAFIKVCLSNPE